MVLLVRIHKLKSLVVIADRTVFSFGREGTNIYRLISKQKALLESALFSAS